jgi:glucose-6-phosphate isomerase
MITFNFKKIGQTPEVFFANKKEILSYLDEIKKTVELNDYNKPESFLILPSLKEIREKINFYKTFFEKFKLVLLVGVGGSSLGSQAIYEALKNQKKLKEFLVIDSLNPLFMHKVVEKVRLYKKDRTLIFFVSKSGKTFESTANFLVLFNKTKKFKPTIFVCSDEGSILWNYAKEKKFNTISIPQKVGGRYSVFTYSHLIPLISLGVDAKKLIEGASLAVKNGIMEENNFSLSSALFIFYHYLNKKNIYANIVFPSDLEYFGKWYIQLMAESIGKDGKGITPIVTTGTTDFHAIGQLYFDGPKDKIMNFVFVKDLGIDYKIFRDKTFVKVFPGMEKRGIWELNNNIFEGVKRAYLKKNIPFTETLLDRLDEFDLGYLFMMKMIEIIILAKLMKVNSFDQPGVELYKQETRDILQK